jgi:hypothetical protein
LELEAFIAKYGEEAIREAIGINIILGTRNNSYAEWLKYAKKYGMCGKGTGLARPSYNKREERREASINADGRWTWNDLPTPRITHMFNLYNGRSQTIMSFTLTDEEHRHYMGE